MAFRSQPLAFNPSVGAAASFQPLALGAGGWLTGMDIVSDGTMVVRTDTLGAYIANSGSTAKWQQLLTAASMPVGSVNFSGSTYVFGTGVYEIRIAPSNTSILYMLYAGGGTAAFYKSTNKGVTWTQLTNFPAITWSANENDAYRMNQKKMAVDPNNANSVVIGTPANGAYYTTDGGNSFTHIAGIATSGTDSNGKSPGITGIAFDAGSGTTGGKTNTVYAASFSNGVYQSTTTLTGTWSLLTSSPAYVEDAIVTSGNYFCASKLSSTGVTGGDTATDLYRWNGSTWVSVLTGDGNGVHAVTVNPANSSIIITANAAGAVQVSTTGGTAGSFTSPNYTITLSSADIPWLAGTNPTFLSAGGFVFDPSTSNKVWLSMGIGVVATTNNWSSFTSSTAYTYASQSAGIEQLVARTCVSPAGGLPAVSVEDRAEFLIINPDVFPASYSTETFVNQTNAGWSVDYAKASISTLVSVNNFLAADQSAYSTDGGRTWTKFSSSPETAGGGKIGGNIAASTASNFVYISAQSPSNAFYTTNTGGTWTAASGLPATGWAASQFNATNILCADSAGNNKFYLANSNANIYASTDSGATWTNVGTLNIVGEYFTPTLLSIPGNAGHLIYATGQFSGPHPNSTYKLQFSSNGGVTWTNVANVTEPWCIGVGAIAPGQTYPTLWLIGWVNNVYGIYVCKNFNTGTASGTWTLLSTYAGSIDTPVFICGDGNDPSKCYIGFQGSGAVYGKNLVY